MHCDLSLSGSFMRFHQDLPCILGPLLSLTSLPLCVSFSSCSWSFPCVWRGISWWSVYDDPHLPPVSRACPPFIGGVCTWNSVTDDLFLKNEYWMFDDIVSLFVRIPYRTPLGTVSGPSGMLPCLGACWLLSETFTDVELRWTFLPLTCECWMFYSAMRN